jgi:hypothetical protein
MQRGRAPLDEQVVSPIDAHGCAHSVPFTHKTSESPSQRS